MNRNLKSLVDVARTIPDNKLLSELPKNSVFKTFISGSGVDGGLSYRIKEFEDENEWYDNKCVLNLIRELQDEIKHHLNAKDNDILSKIIAIFTLIGAEIVIIYKRKKEPKIKEYHLLLIIPANQANGLNNQQKMTKTEVKSIINYARRAYCFLENDQIGKNIADSVKCSDEAIDFQTEKSVFIHLIVSSANTEIINQRIRSNISDQINNDAEIVIKKIAKLQSALSTKDFYDV